MENLSKIRKRQSYQEWKQMYLSLREADIFKVMDYFHNFMNKKHMYGFKNTAHKWEESLALVQEDVTEGRIL